MTQLGLVTPQDERMRDVAAADSRERMPQRSRVRAEARLARRKASTALRLRITGLSVALVALVALVVNVTPKVTIPIGVVFGMGLIANAVATRVHRRKRHDGHVERMSPRSTTPLPLHAL